MKTSEREIIARDSRSGNMIRRLLGISLEARRRRRRWMLLAGSGALFFCKEPEPERKPAKGGV